MSKWIKFTPADWLSMSYALSLEQKGLLVEAMACLSGKPDASKEDVQRYTRCDVRHLRRLWTPEFEQVFTELSRAVKGGGHVQA